VDQAALTERFDIKAALESCRSLRKLRDEVRRILASNPA